MEQGFWQFCSDILFYLIDRTENLPTDAAKLQYQLEHHLVHVEVQRGQFLDILSTLQLQFRAVYQEIRNEKFQFLINQKNLLEGERLDHYIIQNQKS